MRANSTSWGTKEMAFTAKHQPMPGPAMSAPATAGPTTRDPVMRVLLRPTALGMSTSGTRSVTNARRVGFSSAVTVPAAKVSRKIDQSAAEWVSTSTANAMATTAPIAFMIMSRWCRSRRSASTPPQAPRRRMGRNCAAVTSPTATPLSVRASTNSPMATICIQVPV